MNFDTSYETLVLAIDELIEQYNASAICIDGVTGAGKEELAGVLSQRYGAPVIHMKDFVLPLGERAEGWENIPGGHMDFNRFREEIVDPWMQKAPLVYTVYDQVTGEATERKALPDARLYIIEGTYCLHPVIPDFYDLRIFMKGTQEQRLQTGMTPDACVTEDAYFMMYMTELLSDITLDEDFQIPCLVEDAPETEAKPDYSYRASRKKDGV